MKFTDYLGLIGILLAGFSAVMAGIWLIFFPWAYDDIFAKDMRVMVSLLYPVGSLIWMTFLLTHRHVKRKPWPLLAVVVYGLLSFIAVSWMEGVLTSCFFDNFSGQHVLGKEVVNDIKYSCRW